MIKNSTKLIESANEALMRELNRCIVQGNQPSFLGMYYEGYAKGWSDAKGSDKQDLRDLDQWHYIEVEGLPKQNVKCAVLLQCDGYKEIVYGSWERGKRDEVRWGLDWEPPMATVIAWHKIPEIPE